MAAGINVKLVPELIRSEAADKNDDEVYQLFISKWLCYSCPIDQAQAYLPVSDAYTSPCPERLCKSG